MADAASASLPIGLARIVELARATVDPPRVLLLDEPTSGLAAGESDRLADRVNSLVEEGNCSVLLVEHDMDFVMTHCHRVVVVNLGQAIAAGTPQEVRADQSVRAAYLGTG